MHPFRLYIDLNNCRSGNQSQPVKTYEVPLPGWFGVFKERAKPALSFNWTKSSSLILAVLCLHFCQLLLVLFNWKDLSTALLWLDLCVLFNCYWCTLLDWGKFFCMILLYFYWLGLVLLHFYWCLVLAWGLSAHYCYASTAAWCWLVESIDVILLCCIPEHVCFFLCMHALKLWIYFIEFHSQLVYTQVAASLSTHPIFTFIWIVTINIKPAYN